jgi:hypothetical protein
MERAQIEEIIPAMRMCSSKSSEPGFKYHIKQALLNELNLSAPANDEEIEEDPYLLLGFGINSYFDLLLGFAGFFFQLAFWSLPLLIYYSSNSVKGLEGKSMYMLKQFSLGNLGGASTFCKQKSLGTGFALLECPSGTIFDYEQAKYGLLSSELDDMTYCQESAINWDV